MGRLKHTLLFYGLSISAYTSPIVMIVSMLTNYWLFSVERITHHPHTVATTASSTTLTTRASTTRSFYSKINVSSATLTPAITATSTEFTTTHHYELLAQIEASYGLWEICKVTGKF